VPPRMHAPWRLLFQAFRSVGSLPNVVDWPRPKRAEERRFMVRPHPARWLSEQARVGLLELPTNAAWLLSRAVQPGSAAAGTRDKARKLGASLVDAAPVGDSVEARMKRARAAAERAQEAEEEALEAAKWSKESSDRIRQVTESNRAWLAEVKREASRHVEQRVAEARRAADERVAEAQREADQQVEQERAAARREADKELENAQAEAAKKTEAARRDAEAAEQRAKDLLTESRERLAEAKQRADEAVQAASARAEEAQRQARQLTEEAEQQATSARAKVAAAEQVREDATASAKNTARRERTNGNLESQSKPELQHLAASLEIEGHTKMNKAELISAITKAAPKAR
jgi:colicin import membrane protein